jgi:hypothetical protein
MTLEILTGRASAPRRTLIYGVAGIGKTTWAAASDAPIIIQTEEGAGDVGCPRFPIAETFDAVMAAVAHLYEAEHEYRTVVIDSLDFLERLIWDHVCKTVPDGSRKVERIEDYGYGKGYTHALTAWRQLFDGLSALRRDRGMAVILVAHAAVRKFESPDADSYDRYEIKLHKHAAALCMEWCDEVFFANYKIVTKTVTEGFNQKRTQAIDNKGDRVVKTTERPSHLAKNRLGLPDELPLEWDAYAAHFAPSNE